MTRAATNVFASRYLRSRCGLAGPVIYNPVPPSAFTERGEDVPAGDTIVSAGRFVREKGLDVLLRAMAHVDARLVLAGDGPLRGALEALTADLGLGRRVIFPGRVTLPELQALYAEAVLTCVPSDGESLSAMRSPKRWRQGFRWLGPRRAPSLSCWRMVAGSSRRR